MKTLRIRLVDFLRKTEKKVAALTAETYLKERADRASRQRFEKVLAKVPAVEPERFDQ